MTHLYFEHSAIDCDVLNRILKLPRRLESFKYDVGGATVGYSRFAPSRFYQGLCAHTDSLVELFITDEDDTGFFEEIGSVLGSMYAFTALTHLRLSVKVLLGLPPAHLATESTRDRSPLDALLPLSLVILELELGHEYTLKDFMTITGVPKTLTKTSHLLPALRKYHLGVDGILPRFDDLSEIRKEVARLNRQCEDVSVHAHQIVLKAGSPYCAYLLLPLRARHSLGPLVSLSLHPR